MARDVQITFDCADPAALAAFWADVLGYRLQDPPPGFDSWGQALDALGVPEDRRNDASAVVDPDACRLAARPGSNGTTRRPPWGSAISSCATLRATSSASTESSRTNRFLTHSGKGARICTCPRT